MNKEDIICMAREANLPACHLSHPKALKRFAALVAAAEREACAMACEGLTPEWPEQPGIAQAERTTMLDCAAAIRARGQA